MRKSREFRPQVAGALEPRIAPSTYVIRVVNRTSERVALFYQIRQEQRAKQFVAPGQAIRYTYSVNGNAPLHAEGATSHREGIRSVVTGHSYFIANSGARNLRIGNL